MKQLRNLVVVMLIAALPVGMAYARGGGGGGRGGGGRGGAGGGGAGGGGAGGGGAGGGAGNAGGRGAGGGAGGGGGYTQADNIRQQTYFTDEEWTIIQPKLQRVLDAMTPLQNYTRSTGNGGTGGGRGGGGRAGGGGGGRGGTNANPTSVDPLTFALADLNNALQDPNTPDNLIAAKLSALRDARQAAKGALRAAQADLTRVLTVRQETMLVLLGVLE